VAELTLDQITNLPGLLSIRDEWGEVWQASSDRSPFNTWQWVVTWWEHFGRNDELAVLLARRGDALVGIAPLLRARLGVGALAHKMIVGVGQETADYGGLLLGAEPDATGGLFLDKLGDDVARGLTSVNLTRLRPNGDTQLQVQRLVAERGKPRTGRR